MVPQRAPGVLEFLETKVASHLSLLFFFQAAEEEQGT